MSLSLKLENIHEVKNAWLFVGCAFFAVGMAQKAIIYLLLLILGLASCHNNNASKDNSIRDIFANQKIVLTEDKLDVFSIPFPEKNMLSDLKNHYESYIVEAKIGQQDGPDFPYIDIVKNDGNSIVFLSFDYENKYKLDEIRIVDSMAIDEYGIRVGDSYQTIIDKRRGNFKNATDYHDHTYLYKKNSNIYYELTGATMTEDMLENIEELELTDEQLQKCRVEYIIWRKRN